MYVPFLFTFIHVKRFIETDIVTYFIIFTGSKRIEACIDDSITISCGALNGVRGTVVDVYWKALDPKSDPKWIRFGYCNQHMKCIVTTALLPNGIKVLNIVNGTLILQGSVNSTKSQSQLRCEVYSRQEPKAHIVKINFVACKFTPSPLILRIGERGGGG